MRQVLGFAGAVAAVAGTVGAAALVGPAGATPERRRQSSTEDVTIVVRVDPSVDPRVAEEFVRGYVTDQPSSSVIRKGPATIDGQPVWFRSALGSALPPEGYQHCTALSDPGCMWWAEFERAATWSPSVELADGGRYDLDPSVAPVATVSTPPGIEQLFFPSGGSVELAGPPDGGPSLEARCLAFGVALVACRLRPLATVSVEPTEDADSIGPPGLLSVRKLDQLRTAELTLPASLAASLGLDPWRPLRYEFSLPAARFPAMKDAAPAGISVDAFTSSSEWSTVRIEVDRDANPLAAEEYVQRLARAGDAYIERRGFGERGGQVVRFRPRVDPTTAQTLAGELDRACPGAFRRADPEGCGTLRAQAGGLLYPQWEPVTVVDRGPDVPRVSGPLADGRVELDLVDDATGAGPLVIPVVFELSRGDPDLVMSAADAAEMGIAFVLTEYRLTFGSEVDCAVYDAAVPPPRGVRVIPSAQFTSDRDRCRAGGARGTTRRGEEFGEKFPEGFGEALDEGLYKFAAYSTAVRVARLYLVFHAVGAVVAMIVLLDKRSKTTVVLPASPAAGTVTSPRGDGPSSGDPGAGAPGIGWVAIAAGSGFVAAAVVAVVTTSGRAVDIAIDVGIVLLSLRTIGVVTLIGHATLGALALAVLGLARMLRMLRATSRVPSEHGAG